MSVKRNVKTYLSTPLKVFKPDSNGGGRDDIQHVVVRAIDDKLIWGFAEVGGCQMLLHLPTGTYIRQYIDEGLAISIVEKLDEFLTLEQVYVTQADKLEDDVVDIIWKCAFPSRYQAGEPVGQHPDITTKDQPTTTTTGETIHKPCTTPTTGEKIHKPYAGQPTTASDYQPTTASDDEKVSH